jgi:hypothetical protein
MKNRPVGAEFHADGQTAVTKLIVVFRNFANAPENWEQVDIHVDGATVLFLVIPKCCFGRSFVFLGYLEGVMSVRD